jgi:serine/threonine protein kinase/formylglycine-generating enzyme required for sulfatase activity
MGEVYLGHDRLLDRPVAIKFLLAAEPDAEQRRHILAEARAAARLQHPNVVTVYRVGEIDDRPYLVSEFVHGQTLACMPVPLPWQRVLELGIGVARGLAAAHRSGVLHGDIKPVNVILTEEGQIKLLDFGLAQLVEAAEPPSTATGARPSRPAQAHRLVPPPGSARVPPAVSPTPPPVAPPVASAPAPAEPQPQTQRAGPFRTRSLRPHRGETPADGAPARCATADPAALPAETPPEPPPMLAACQPASRSRTRQGPVPVARSVTGDYLRGTPCYIAPELILGEPATRRSDIYATGALLYELCTGAPPHDDVPLERLWEVLPTVDVPPLATVVPGVDPRLAAVIDRCLRRNPGERYASGAELLEALERLGVNAPAVPVPAGNPYRGLLPFEAEHRSLFFGRASDIGTLLDRLRTEGQVLVVADSGVGKSSLCRAGVLPLVQEGALGNRRWHTAVLVPGRHPVEALSRAVAEALETDEEMVRTALRTNPEGWAHTLHRLLGREQGLLLFIDQLEELVTTSDPEEAALLGVALEPLATPRGGLRLLMAARSDFLSRLVEVPGLGEGLARSLHFLRPLGREQIREAIVGPAAATGVRFESAALIDNLVDSAIRSDAGLPLLQFTLAELWEARRQDTITAESLRSIGGVVGALARHADRVVGSLPRARASGTVARRLLMALVTLEGTRMRRGEEELLRGCKQARIVLEALVRGRLVVARDTPEGPAYEVAHEALIKGWGTLRRWLEEHAESRAALERLEIAAREWHRLGRTQEVLWSARQLGDAALIDPATIGPREEDFLVASRRAVVRERRRRQLVLALLPLVPLVFYGTMRLGAWRDLERRAAASARTGGQELEAARRENEAALTLSRKALAFMDAQDLAAGEEVWARARDAAERADQAYGRAGQLVEAAILAQGAQGAHVVRGAPGARGTRSGRAELHDLLGDILYERVLLAERTHRSAQFEELRARLALYDAAGVRRRRLAAPGHVRITSQPAGATVEIQEYLVDPQRQRRLGPAHPLGTTPLEPIELAQGSYLLTLKRPGPAPGEAPDEPVVRYPFVVERAAELTLDVPLPRPGEIPAGYVYVPPGRFLFGTASEEMVRQTFLSTVPIHEQRTGAYLIARYETTYGDWVEFLRALPPHERVQHLPRGHSSQGGPNLELRELDDGRWQLLMQPVVKSFLVREGERVHYPTRRLHAVQDWLRMPVGGLSQGDALAYAAWLDRTGRVPGARLCDEYEWERAARGADDRELPNGDALGTDDANYDLTYGREGRDMGPDEVGTHPASRSPFGVEDMAGNVIEWTRSRLNPGEGLIRGGSYFHALMTQRSTNRSPIDPGFHEAWLGVRICADYPAPPRSKSAARER